MTNQNQNNIQCPNCGGNILIDTYILLMGGSFSCASLECDVSIALSSSSYEKTNHAMQEFEQLKNNL